MDDLSRQHQDEADAEWVRNLVVTAQKRGIYGTISVELKAGRVGMARLEETFKPPRENNPEKG